MGSGETRSIQEIPNQQIIESSSLRTAAWAAGEVDSTVIHEDQYEQAEGEVTDPVRIATLYEDVDTFVKEVQAAEAGWLEENRELAAKYCATTLVAMHQLKSDFDLFVEAVNTYVEDPPEEDACGCSSTSSRSTPSGPRTAGSARTAWSSWSRSRPPRAC